MLWTSAVGGNQGGVGFNRHVVVEVLKGMSEFMCQARVVCERERDELVDVASAGKSESNFCRRTDKQTPLSFQPSLLERVQSSRRQIKTPEAEQIMQELMSLVQNCYKFFQLLKKKKKSNPAKTPPTKPTTQLVSSVAFLYSELWCRWPAEERPSEGIPSVSSQQTTPTQPFHLT